jgi:hypothetical protein
MNFNISWHGSFDYTVHYITSFPVIFDYKHMRFTTRFSVAEKRDSSDPEPFFSLPRPKREAILKAGITALEELLVGEFPEIKKNANLLYVDFDFHRHAGGSSIVAKYEAGKLNLIE